MTEGHNPFYQSTQEAVIAALVQTHKQTCDLIAVLPVCAVKSRDNLIQELISITCAIDEFGHGDPASEQAIEPTKGGEEG